MAKRSKEKEVGMQDRRSVLNVLSLGAGVQSTTMALMAAHGEIEPMPDCAIFADTGAEPQHVYDQLDMVEANVPFPVYRVMEKKGLEDAVIEGFKGNRFAGAPFYCETDHGPGMLRRQCTNEFKIRPINRKIRELLGLEKGQRGPKDIAVSQWIGISMDEVIRMRPHQTKWILNRWPLVEMQMYRYDCVRWMDEHGFEEPKKSACYFCPYMPNTQWQDMKDHDPESFEKAVKMDELIRPGVRKDKKERLFLHRSMKPVKDCDFDPDRDQFDMFDEDCEGMCGV